MRSWTPDVLGDGYEATTLPLGHDDEGEVVATLVRHQVPSVGRVRRAVLYVHGFNDYFFQRHLADFFADHGYAFYALELRKYGRSLRDHQTPNYCRSISDYFPELDEAVRIIRDEEGHGTLLLSAHSTGGLVIALWADRTRGKGLIDGLFLNSPFFDLNIPAPLRVISGPLMRTVTAVRPMAIIPAGPSHYTMSLHRDHHGEWDFDLRWKPVDSFAVRAGWLAAIRRAQRRVHAGLSIDVPVLVMAAARKIRVKAYTPEIERADAVLDPEHMARWSAGLGSEVTCVRIEDGVHDLVLSAPPVRKRVFAELETWLARHLP